MFALRPPVALCLLLMAACGDDGGGGDPGPVDSSPGGDADARPTEAGVTDAGDAGSEGDACTPTVEICGDRVDQNCDGRDQSCGDNDADRYDACRAEDDLATCDCDDDHATAYPGHPEECDGFDNDCNGRVDEAAACCAGCSGVREGAADQCDEAGACDCSTEAGTGPCVAPGSCCESGCVDTETDMANCGSCGIACDNTADRCVDGACRCGAGPPCDFVYDCTAGSCG